jgi:hypothetical protein
MLVISAVISSKVNNIGIKDVDSKCSPELDLY